MSYYLIRAWWFVIFLFFFISSFHSGCRHRRLHSINLVVNSCRDISYENRVSLIYVKCVYIQYGSVCYIISVPPTVKDNVVSVWKIFFSYLVLKASSMDQTPKSNTNMEYHSPPTSPCSLFLSLFHSKRNT